MKDDLIQVRPVLVHATAGVLRVSHHNGMAVFRGIPFAEPPVGSFRSATQRPARRLEESACYTPKIPGRRAAVAPRWGPACA